MAVSFPVCIPCPITGPGQELPLASHQFKTNSVRDIPASPAARDTWILDLAQAGYVIDQESVSGPEELKRLGRQPPSAVVIDLDRAPARGRDIALAFRQRAATRRIPIVFVASDRAVFARLKALPLETRHAAPEDAVTAVASALSMPPSGTAPPTPPGAGYSGTPLPRKLGIKAGSRAVLVKPPEGFADLLQPLPADVVLRSTNRGIRDVTLWFTRSRRELERDMARVARAAGGGRLWVVWPKRSSPLAADHTERDVRRVGIAAGLVDFKVCAIDADGPGWRSCGGERGRNAGEHRRRPQSSGAGRRDRFGVLHFVRRRERDEKRAGSRESRHPGRGR